MSKRGAGAIEEDASSMSQTDVEDLIRSFTDNLNLDIQTKLQSLEQNFTTQVATLARGLEQANGIKIAKVQSEIDHLKTNFREQQSEQKRLVEQVVHMQEQLAMLESKPTHEVLDQDTFNAPPNLSILHFGTNEHVNKNRVREVAYAMCAKASIPDTTFSLEGDELGKNFSLQFKGDYTLASKRANLVNRSLLLPNGKWEDKFVTSPLAEPTRLYISLDKSRKALFVESTLKQVKNATIKLKQCSFERCKLRKPNRKYTGEGRVLFDDSPICKVIARGFEDWEYLWDYENLKQAGLSKETILAEIDRGLSEREASSSSRWRS